jgi:hypothetical protein
MRWIFLDPLNPQEAAYRAEKNRQMNAWWAAFAETADELDKVFSGRSKFDLPAWMNEHLSSIDEGLMWEFGPAVRGEGHRLVITPEANRHLRPLVNTLLSRAPEIQGWEFYPYRLPETIEMAAQQVEARTGGNLNGGKVQAAAGDAGKVDLVYCLPQCASPGDEAALFQAFVATETLLGEETLDTWIGAIDVEPPPKAGFLGRFRKQNRLADLARLVPLEQLRGNVESLVAQHVGQLPGQPCWQMLDDSNWSLCELTPQAADDYAGREDLILAIAARPEIIEASVRGPFSSRRYSRFGETFCYVKLDRPEDADPLKYREPLENAVNARLAPASLGCVIGGGTGIRYSYIDLALTDLQRGVAAVRDALREQNVPPRTWIQFLDDELSAEWVGVHSEAPPPP